MILVHCIDLLTYTLADEFVEIFARCIGFFDYTLAIYCVRIFVHRIDLFSYMLVLKASRVSPNETSATAPCAVLTDVPSIDIEASRLDLCS